MTAKICREAFYNRCDLSVSGFEPACHADRKSVGIGAQILPKKPFIPPNVYT